MNWPDDYINKLICGDCLKIIKELPNECINCVITSPPYWGLRDYGHDEQIGLEKTPEEYVIKMVELFREVRRILKDDGTLWLNLGDSYIGGGRGQDYCNEGSIQKAQIDSGCKYGKPTGKIDGLKAKDLCGIPWMVAFALRADGWYLRQDIIWHKPNPMPESVTDRCTRSHEYIFLLSKSAQYYYDHELIKEDAICKKDPRADYGRLHYRGKREGKEGTGQESFVSIVENRNKRSVWTVTTKPFSGAHFATFPQDLILPMVLAGCPHGGIVFDPFMGAGTTALVAKKNGCNFIGCELNPEYIKIAKNRTSQEYFL